MAVISHRPVAPSPAGHVSTAPKIIQELANAINSAGDPATVFSAVLHFLGATAELPDDVKASIFHKMGNEWDALHDR